MCIIQFVFTVHVLIWKYYTHGDLFGIPYMMGDDDDFIDVSVCVYVVLRICSVNCKDLRLNANCEWNSMHKMHYM